MCRANPPVPAWRILAWSKALKARSSLGEPATGCADAASAVSSHPVCRWDGRCFGAVHSMWKTPGETVLAPASSWVAHAEQEALVFCDVGWATARRCTSVHR
jgi:hypothetical protein